MIEDVDSFEFFPINYEILRFIRGNGTDTTSNIIIYN